jgi:hypothetical protein
LNELENHQGHQRYPSRDTVPFTNQYVVWIVVQKKDTVTILFAKSTRAQTCIQKYQYHMRKLSILKHPLHHEA